MATTTSSIIKHSGVLAIVTTTDTSGSTDELVSLGNPTFFAAGKIAIGFLALTEESEIRVVVGDATVIVLRSTSGAVAAVVTTGHPVIKSMKRMLRKLLRGMAKPVVANTTHAGLSLETASKVVSVLSQTSLATASRGINQALGKLVSR